MRVSLVIPLRNEEASIDALFQSIREQTRLPDEVVVVDAGSTDGTLSWIRRLAETDSTTIIECGELYPGLARNIGVEAAHHEWIAFTDGGIRLDAGWLATLCDAAKAGNADVVLGNYHPVCDSEFRRAAAIAYVPPLDANGLRGPSVASMLVRKAAIQRVGGFPPYRAAEDLVLFERLLSPPCKFVVAPEAGIRWQLPAGPPSLFRRFSLYSYHNLVARRGRGWHRGVARLYAMLTGVTCAAWVVVGVPAILVVPCFFLARAAKAAWVKRRSFDFSTLRPFRVMHAAALLIAIDFATVTGAVRWLMRSPPRN